MRETHQKVQDKFKIHENFRHSRDNSRCLYGAFDVSLMSTA